MGAMQALAMKNKEQSTIIDGALCAKHQTAASPLPKN
jgi:hypothetical protein|tara:strand:- start:11775 stop:11885 length:111 start_codon:yes stop_codon:yes gene_type:complete